MADFETQVAEYAQALEAFRAEYDLPSEWFAVPDHLAIKCADATNYEATIEQWLPLATQLSFIHMSGRRLATARLLAPIGVGNLGSVEWLEIMEPRPEKVGLDPVGIDHMEFEFDDFEAAAKILGVKGIAFEPEENPGHKWLSIPANGHEFKLNNRMLADVVASETSSGEATVLK